MSDRQLATNHAPILIFSKDELFFPMDADEYIKRCSLHWKKSGTEDHMLVPPGLLTAEMLAHPHVNTKNTFLTYADRRGFPDELLDAIQGVWSPLRMAAPPPSWAAPPLVALALPDLDDVRRRVKGVKKVIEQGLQKLNDLAESVEDFFESLPQKTCELLAKDEDYWQAFRKLRALGNLFFPDHVYREVLNQCKGHETAPLYYYRVVPCQGEYDTAVQYWFFYAFNPHVNRHEADWEQVTLFFSDEKPQRAAYSSHKNGHIYEWDDLDTITDPQTQCERPVVYVAKDSHANYESGVGVRRESGQRISAALEIPVDEWEPGGVLVGLPPTTDFKDSVLENQQFEACRAWVGEVALSQELSWLNFAGCWGVDVQRSGDLPGGPDPISDGDPQNDHDNAILSVLIEGVPDGVALINLLRIELGTAPTGPSQKSCWLDPLSLFDHVW